MDILGCWVCVGNVPWCLPLAGWGLGWIGNDCGLVFVGVEVDGFCGLYFGFGFVLVGVDRLL